MAKQIEKELHVHGKKVEKQKVINSPVKKMWPLPIAPGDDDTERWEGEGGSVKSEG